MPSKQINKKVKRWVDNKKLKTSTNLDCCPSIQSKRGKMKENVINHHNMERPFEEPKKNRSDPKKTGKLKLAIFIRQKDTVEIGI